MLGLSIYKLQVQYNQSWRFQFEDDKWYKKFRIEKTEGLDDDNLAKNLSKSEAEVYAYLENLTEFKKSFELYNMILFRICRLIKKATHPEIMKNHGVLDDFFDGKLGYAMSMAEAFK